MRYLVGLDANSTTGKLFLANNDGFMNDGTQDHPLLECSDLGFDNPYYIYAIRDTRKAGGKHQSLYLPHGNVILIVEFDKKVRPPMGFLSQARD